jgi:N-acetyl sugar amidotransferase
MTPYQICTRCVLDTSATEIIFDENGFCNYCTDVLRRSRAAQARDARSRKAQLQEMVDRIRKDGAGKPYDCIIGVSGGADSSWMLVQAVKMGLRPLAVHMDNGWNAELAQNNISNLVTTLGVDLHTHVINWVEYRQLMQAFFDADVIDVELLYDNAMLGVNYQMAAKHGVRYILSGSNQATEGIYTPKGWNWYKFDEKNIRAIGRQVGGVKPTTFPFFSTMDYLWYRFVRRIEWLSPLDLMDYNKTEAMAQMTAQYGYKVYPYKHYESVFTRFYQGYLLPEKFGVDKRRLHYSALIMSGQMTRAEALERCEGIAYPGVKELEDDRKYFLKKMGWTREQLEQYIARPEVPHSRYPTERSRWDHVIRVGRWLRNRK